MTRVITAELDPALAHGVMDMFAGDDIDVMHADWSSLTEHGPFSLIFMDAGSAKSCRASRSSTCSTAGGMIVLDDFVPVPPWPPLEGGRVDTLRLDWLADERFTSVDVMVAEDTSVIIAVKLSSARRFGDRPPVSPHPLLVGRRRQKALRISAASR